MLGAQNYSSGIELTILEMTLNVLYDPGTHNPQSFHNTLFKLMVLQLHWFLLFP